MRFIHTADWQIGKSFRRYGENESVLRRARLDSIERIGALALSENAPLVLVAGDVFDHFAPSDQTAGEPLERMRAFADVRWLLLPGNHDPHRPDAVWDRLLRRGLPANVTPLLAPQPFALSPEAVVLPAPLLRNSETSDLTRWMEDAPSPPGVLRIGLAHGAVVGFSEQQEAANRIDPGRARSAGLAYLALGDWHRTMQINERVWYSGTHEPDRAGGQKIGQALLVEIEGADAPPRVSARDVGAYRWETLALDLAGRSAQDVETSLRALPDPQRMLVRIGFSGAAPLALRAQTEKLIDDLRAAFFHIEADFDSVRPYPSEDDLDALDFDGVLRKSAEILRAEAADETRPAQDRRIATDALVALYGLEMSRRAAGGAP